MDRQIVYPGAIPLETDLLNSNRNVLVALAKLAQAVWGTSSASTPLVHGLACTPTTPASLQVSVAPGQIYAVEDLDATAYSSLAADTTDLILKQGIVLASTSFTLTPPVSTGQSVVYLIEAAYEDVDGGAVTLPYYNASNPAQAYAGPNNSGVAQNTVRQGQCVLELKAGIAANTGSQTAPSADPGFTPLWTVTVANGQTQITSANIAQVAGAPFLAGLLNQHHLGLAGGAPKIVLTQEVQGILPFANLPVGLCRSQCRLQFQDTGHLIVMPAAAGGFVYLDGVLVALAIAGLSLANTGVFVGGNSNQTLAASTVYDVYLASGGSGTLIPRYWACPTVSGVPGGSTHMPSSTAGNFGNEVYNNGGSPDNSQTYIGKVVTNASGQFQDSPTVRGVASWFNRRARRCLAFGNSTTGSVFPSWVALGLASFSTLLFGDEGDLEIHLSGEMITGTPSIYVGAYWDIWADGASLNPNEPQPFAATMAQGSDYTAGVCGILNASLAEGLHAVAGYHCVNASSESIELLAYLSAMPRI